MKLLHLWFKFVSIKVKLQSSIGLITISMANNMTGGLCRVYCFKRINQPAVMNCVAPGEINKNPREPVDYQVSALE